MSQGRVVVIGQGYVGLPLALRAAEVGFEVVGFDTSADRVAALNRGQSYVGDVSDEQLAAAFRRGYRATANPDDLAGFDIAVISVPTPLRDGKPDLSFIEQAAATIGPHLRRGSTVILESTTYPGTTTELLRPLLDATSGLTAGADYSLGYSPERIDPGNPTWNLVNTPKVVSGVDRASLDAVEQFYAQLVERTVAVASTAEAELVKLLENTFRHVNIALVNELALVADQLGIDIWRTIDAASTKPFGYMRFTPGPGVGGHCLPVDPSYLSWQVKQRTGHDFRFVELANEINASMPDHVAERASALLTGHGIPVAGAKVVLLGLAYKAATSDWRESPSVPVARSLAERGAQVVFCDPFVAPVDVAHLRFSLVEWSGELLQRADLVVVLVDHPQFDPAFIAGNARLVLDTRNLLRDQPFTGETL